MRTIKIKAVVITNGDEHFIHGASKESSSDMFKAMSPIWSFDPGQETAHVVELEITLPEFEKPDATPVTG